MSAAAMVLAAWLLTIWDDWYVNWDGGFYLSLAQSLAAGEGYRFPDQTPALFRGPVYPSLFAAAWTVLPETARSAMWVSRAVLMVNVGLTAAIASRLTSRPWAGLVAGAVAAVQPLPLIAGGLFFVPDGTAAMFVLAAVLLTIWREPSQPWTVAATGALLGLAFLAKESFAIAAILPLALVASRRSVKSAVGILPPLAGGWLTVVGLWILNRLVVAGQLPEPFATPVAVGALVVGLAAVLVLWLGRVRITVGRLPLAIGTAGLAVVGLGALMVVVPPTRSLRELWTVVGDELNVWAYGSSPLWLVAGLGFGAFALVWARRAEVAAVAILLGAVGLAMLAHSSLAEIGPRNGVLLAYAVALAFGGAVALFTRWPLTLAGLAMAFAFVWINVGASYFANDRLDEAEHTWAAPLVEDAAAWLADRGPGRQVVGTPVFLSYMYFVQPDLRVELLPIFSGERAALDDRGELEFDRQLWWAGTVDGAPDRADRLVAASVGRRVVGALFEEALAKTIAGADFVVVTGTLNQIASPFDGGTLLPKLDTAPELRRVYDSGLAGLPRWVVIYEVVSKPTGFGDPIVVKTAPDVPTFGFERYSIELPAYEAVILEHLARSG